MTYAAELRLIQKYFGRASAASSKLLQSESLAVRTRDAFRAHTDAGFITLFGKHGGAAARNGQSEAVGSRHAN